MEEPGFWDDPEVSQQVMKELKGLQDSVKEIEKLYSDYEDMMLLIEMSEEEDSEETAEEIEEELQQFEETSEELRIGTLLYTMTEIIYSRRFMPGRAVQNLVTGPECSTVCIRGGRKRKGTVSKSWIILREMWQE